jgi:hypothetical protein
MFNGEIGQEFIIKRLAIAKVHKRVGLELKSEDARLTVDNLLTDANGVNEVIQHLADFALSSKLG